MRGYTGSPFLEARSEIMRAGMKETKRQWFYVLIFLAAIILIVFMRGAHAGGDITVQVNEEALGVNSSGGEALFVRMSDIHKVALMPVEEIDFGTQAEGVSDSKNRYEGSYENEEWGNYRALIGTRSEKAIVVSYTDGVLVFTGLSDRDTETIYENIMEEWNE